MRECKLGTLAVQQPSSFWAVRPSYSETHNPHLVQLALLQKDLEHHDQRAHGGQRVHKRPHILSSLLSGSGKGWRCMMHSMEAFKAAASSSVPAHFFPSR